VFDHSQTDVALLRACILQLLTLKHPVRCLDCESIGGQCRYILHLRLDFAECYVSSASHKFSSLLILCVCALRCINFSCVCVCVRECVCALSCKHFACGCVCL
jgi:hypothetical protein